jgi:hypothetical protein
MNAIAATAPYKAIVENPPAIDLREVEAMSISDSIQDFRLRKPFLILGLCAYFSAYCDARVMALGLSRSAMVLISARCLFKSASSSRQTASTSRSDQLRWVSDFYEDGLVSTILTQY